MPIPFSTDLPSAVGLSGSSGNQQQLVRSDHIHAHGDHPGGSLHARVSDSGSGFVPAVSGAADLASLANVGISSSWILPSGSGPASGTISQGGRNLFGSLVIALSNSIIFDESLLGNNNLKVSGNLSEALWFGDISNNRYLSMVTTNSAQRIEITNVPLQFKKRLTYHSGTTINLTNGDSGRLISNSGSSGSLTASLPLMSQVADGYFIHGRIRVQQYLILKASGSDVISMVGIKSSPGGYIRSLFTGSSVELEKQSEFWFVKDFDGEWEIA